MNRSSAQLGQDFGGRFPRGGPFRADSADIPQMTSKSVEIVLPFHRQGNGIPSAAIRWPDFGDRPSVWSWFCLLRLRPQPAEGNLVFKKLRRRDLPDQRDEFRPRQVQHQHAILEPHLAASHSALFDKAVEDTRALRFDTTGLRIHDRVRDILITCLTSSVYPKPPLLVPTPARGIYSLVPVALRPSPA